MILTEKQFLVMLSILESSLHLSDDEFFFSSKERLRLLSEIVNQQIQTLEVKE